MKRGAFGQAAVALALALGGAQPALAQTPEPKPEPEAAALRVAIGVDLSGLPEATAQRIDALGLETRVVQRLLQEGFAVVAPFAQPHVLLSAVDHPEGLRLLATAEKTEEAVTVTLGSGTRAELQLEIAQKLVELARTRARAVAQELERPPRADEPPKPALRPIIIPQVPPPPKKEEVDVRVSVGADALWRGPLDGLVRLGVAVSSEARVGLGMSAGFSPSTGEGLQVREWQLAAGPRFRLAQGDVLSAHLSVLAGTVAHQFSATGVGVLEPEGLKLDVLLCVPVELTFPLSRWLSLGLRVAPGVAGRGREHRRDDQSLWRREAARLEAGGTVAATF